MKRADLRPENPGNPITWLRPVFGTYQSTSRSDPRVIVGGEVWGAVDTVGQPTRRAVRDASLAEVRW